MKNAKQVLKKAENVTRRVESWADLSNALFDPVNGLLTRAYPSRAEREEFVKTEQYRRIRELLGKAIDTYGLVEGATPKKSGRFVVRLPESLHLALEREAVREGVSLNQLVVAKLATQLSSVAGQPIPGTTRRSGRRSDRNERRPMSQVVTATFAGGVLKPDSPVGLPTRSRVRIVIELLEPISGADQA